MLSSSDSSPSESLEASSSAVSEPSRSLLDGAASKLNGGGEPTLRASSPAPISESPSLAPPDSSGGGASFSVSGSDSAGGGGGGGSEPSLGGGGDAFSGAEMSISARIERTKPLPLTQGGKESMRQNASFPNQAVG